MKTSCFLISLFILHCFGASQPVLKELDKAVQKLQNDSQAIHALVSFYVINSKSGEVVYNKNAEVGLAVASSQKIIISLAALELLGKGFRYKTDLRYSGTIENRTLNGDLIISGYGDPALGSWRYANTKEEDILSKWANAVSSAGIKTINGQVVVDASNWETQTIPGGWVWDDIGNYYGAGVAGVNWRENQYDLRLKPGVKEGDKASIIATIPKLYGIKLESELKTGKRGSGDRSIIFLPPQSTYGVLRGTIPLGDDPFIVSGSFPDPPLQLNYTLREALAKKGILVSSPSYDTGEKKANTETIASTLLLTHYSPSLDSINYWFLKRSINLYGEAFVKTIAWEKTGFGSADSGISIIKRFWADRGIESSALQLMDGCGLSPQNRITAKALVNAMQYARAKPYFASFYGGLPEINNIKMKSGSIGGARSFTGYINSSDGNSYTFAIVINGYIGSSLAIVRKLYAVLDVLK